MNETPRVIVAVLAFGPEPDLAACVESVLASDGVAVSIRLVDNGCSNPRLAELAARLNVELLTPAANTGFAGGCNLALRDAAADVVAMVNSDAVVHPQALRTLADVARDASVGIACADVRLLEEPDLLNTRGNPVHLSGLTWAGGLGEPASGGPPADVAAATGAVMAMRAQLWAELGGFGDRYFAYHEDVEISLRCWGEGLRVVHVPEAVAFHRYEFARNPRKLYLLERNRLMTVLTVYPAALLLRLLPVLVALELAMLPVAAAGGWWREKVDGYRWLWRQSGWLLRRRREVQRRFPPGAERRIAGALSPTFAPVVLEAPPTLLALCNALCTTWWSLSRPGATTLRRRRR